MASAKKIEGWFRDLRDGPQKKRKPAARQLAFVDPEGVRRVLREVLGDTHGRPARRGILQCLQIVADTETARLILSEPGMNFSVEEIATGVLADLYAETRGALASMSVTELEASLTRLGLFRPRLEHGAADELLRWQAELLALLLAVIDDPRLAQAHGRAAHVVMQLGTPASAHALVERWQRGVVGAAHACVAWVHLGCPGGGAGPVAQRLIDALIAELPRDPDMSVRAVDDLVLGTGASGLPAELARRLITPLVEGALFARISGPAAKRLFELLGSTPSALAEILDDPRLQPCHLLAGQALLARDVDGARAVLARWERVPQDLLGQAGAKLPPVEAYELASAHITEQGWYPSLVASPGSLRDPRFATLAESRAESLPDRGRAMLVAIAKDPNNDARANAVVILSKAAQHASDRLEKRYALYALGETGHPNATVALMEALDDPNLRDVAPLVCTALAACGDTRAIAVLEARAEGLHGPFIKAAIEGIRARLSQIHAAVLLAACQDDDPVIADLARRARKGEDDAAVVLEDALRERGLL